MMNEKGRIESPMTGKTGGSSKAVGTLSTAKETVGAKIGKTESPMTKSGAAVNSLLTQNVTPTSPSNPATGTSPVWDGLNKIHSNVNNTLTQKAFSEKISAGIEKGIKSGEKSLDNGDTGSAASSVAVLAGHRVIKTAIENINEIKTAVENKNVLKQGIKTQVPKTAGNAVKTQIPKSGGKAVKTQVAKSAVNNVKTRVPKFSKKKSSKFSANLNSDIKDGLKSAENKLSNSEDLGTSAAGNISKGVRTAVRGIKTAPQAAKATYNGLKTAAAAPVKAGRAAVKTGKTVSGDIKNTVGTVKKLGAGQSAGLLRRKAVSGAKKAAAQAAKAAAEAIKAFLKKIVSGAAAPIIVIILAVGGIAAASGGISGILSVIFGEIFSLIMPDGSHQEFNIHDYLLAEVPPKRAAFIESIKNEYDTALTDGGYHYVRVYSDGSDEEVPYAKIGTTVYPVAELISIIQPVFWAKTFDSSFEMTQSAATALINDIWDTIVGYSTEEAPVEYCEDTSLSHYIPGVSADAAHYLAGVNSGEAHYHAVTGCPNHTDGYHTAVNPHDYCDTEWYMCLGHLGSQNCGREAHSHSSGCYTGLILTCGKSEHSHSGWSSPSSSGCYSTTYHNGGSKSYTAISGCYNYQTGFDCSGYSYCMGHKILNIFVRMDGIYALIAKYYTNPIDSLASINPRTEAQEKQLQALKGSYDMCLIYLAEVLDRYGYGSSDADLTGVVWVSGTRTGSQAVIDYALTQVGQVGGQPYWKFMGFSTRQPWCACFASYCVAQRGYSQPRFTSCQNGGIPYFQGAGQWRDSSFKDLAPGDFIFFDWERDGHSDHVGLVIGRDDTYVYTVEGNSGDAVKVKMYPLTSSVIVGYGLPNY